ncbi:MAG: hypothetical protein HFF51_10955 [Lawsonibacter sp.]|nr:hypothetical protein [Lawsonibacter sp.]
MTNQQQAAVAAMTEWLAHPQELGKAPAKIEIAGCRPDRRRGVSLSWAI